MSLFIDGVEQIVNGKPANEVADKVVEDFVGWVKGKYGKYKRHYKSKAYMVGKKHLRRSLKHQQKGHDLRGKVYRFSAKKLTKAAGLRPLTWARLHKTMYRQGLRPA